MTSSQGFRFRLLEDQDYPEVSALSLRQSDQDELVAAYGLSPQKALLTSVAASAQTWVLIFNGSIEGVAGVTEYRRLLHKRPDGMPWLLTTDKFSEFRISLAKEAKKLIRRLVDNYSVLFNYVDSRNTTSITWLKWLGFTVDEAHPHYLHDPAIPFYLFYLESS